MKTVRVRLTLLTALFAAITLVVAAVLAFIAVYQSSGRSADVATTARARQVAAVLESKGLAGLDESLLTPGRYIHILQVVDGSGRVVFAGEQDPHTPLSLGFAPGETDRLSGLRAEPEGPVYRTTLIGVRTPQDGSFTVEVGADEAYIYGNFRTLVVLSAIAIPFVVLGAAALTYLLVTRALKPVDDIRRQVDHISGGDLNQRVPVPDTGDEIATLATTMNAMLDRIDAARTRQMRFVNDASHELNSPLTTLVGLLDLSREKWQSIDPKTVDTVMMPEALRLQSMVADLLLLAKADEKGVPLAVTDVDVDDIVGAEVARLEALGDVEVSANIVAARVRGDQGKLARAVRNITDNAVRHSRGRIDFTMSISDDGTEVSVMVSDNGEGIADCDKTRVLERFVRLDNARDRARGGSGLGLSIVDEIIRAHGGSVVVEDAALAGAAIGFTLPAAR